MMDMFCIFVYPFFFLFIHADLSIYSHDEYMHLLGNTVLRDMFDLHCPLILLVKKERETNLHFAN
jgi:hypothetical protein